MSGNFTLGLGNIRDEDTDGGNVKMKQNLLVVEWK